MQQSCYSMTTMLPCLRSGMCTWTGTSCVVGAMAYSSVESCATPWASGPLATGANTVCQFQTAYRACSSSTQATCQTPCVWTTSKVDNVSACAPSMASFVNLPTVFASRVTACGQGFSNASCPASFGCTWTGTRCEAPVLYFQMFPPSQLSANVLGKILPGYQSCSPEGSKNQGPIPLNQSTCPTQNCTWSNASGVCSVFAAFLTGASVDATTAARFAACEATPDQATCTANTDCLWSGKVCRAGHPIYASMFQCPTTSSGGKGGSGGSGGSALVNSAPGALTASGVATAAAVAGFLLSGSRWA